MENIQIDTIEQYNSCFGFKTKFPLVDVVHLDQAENQLLRRMTLGFYALFLKEMPGCPVGNGGMRDDFSGVAVVHFAPGQTGSIHRAEEGLATAADGILFHPDLLPYTSLSRKIKRYAFLSYGVKEVLFLSTEERIILQHHMEKIAHELQSSAKKFPKLPVISHIEALLDHCAHFYERQFATHSGIYPDALAHFEQLLDKYLNSGMAMVCGVPTPELFADKIHLSHNYLEDLVKAETGETAQEYIQRKMISVAKESLLTPHSTPRLVSDMLGFSQPQHFTLFFKKRVGCTPAKFQKAACVKKLVVR